MKTKLLVCSLLILLGISSLYGQYQPGHDGWNFYNFLMTTDSVKLWRIYSKAFLGVSTNYSSASMEDQLFFDLVVSRYAGHADCFGMSLLSLLCYKEGGHLGVCSPVYDYEGDLSASHGGPDMELIRESIGIMQLRQLTQPMLEEIVDMVNDANYSQPLHHFGVIKAGLASHDYPLLSFMPSSISSISGATGGGQEAHTIVPISTTETATYARIYVYDPNRPYSQWNSFYNGAAAVNYLQIDKTSSTKDWIYPADYIASDSNSYGWKGGSSADWTFIATNISAAKYKDNHALSTSWLLGQIGTLIFSGEGGVRQISDEQGHEFFNWRSGAQQLEKDPARRTLDIIRWPFFAGRDTHKAEVYFCRNVDGRTLHIEVDSRGKAYDCRFLSKDNAVSLSTGPAGTGIDTLSIQAVNSSQQIITIGSQRDLALVRMNLWRRSAPNKIARGFELSQIAIKKDAPVCFSMTDNLDSLQVASPKVEFSYQLEISQTIKSQASRSQTYRLVLPAGQSQAVSPSDWLDLNKAQITPALKSIKATLKN